MNKTQKKHQVEQFQWNEIFDSPIDELAATHLTADDQEAVSKQYAR